MNTSSSNNKCHPLTSVHLSVLTLFVIIKPCERLTTKKGTSLCQHCQKGQLPGNLVDTMIPLATYSYYQYGKINGGLLLGAIKMLLSVVVIEKKINAKQCVVGDCWMVIRKSMVGAEKKKMKEMRFACVRYVHVSGAV